MRTVVIVGGIAGGAAAAARLRRLDETARIIVFERGEHISLATCGLPYYVGGEIAHRERLLVQTREAFAARFGVEVCTGTEVVSIDRARQAVEVREVGSGRRYRQGYDTLILSPGAGPVRPKLPGVDGARVFTLRNLEDAERIRSAARERADGKAVVVGGGFIGLEMAENLRRAGLDVTVVEMLDQVLPMVDREIAEFVHQHLGLQGVELVLSDAVAGFAALPDGRVRVATASGRNVECDLAVLAVGVRPEVELARQAGLAIGPLGGIRVDDHFRTSDPHIYAIGDAVEVANLVTGGAMLAMLAGPAARQGRMVADVIGGREVAYSGALGTAIVRVFELSVASVGANERALRERGMEYLKSYTQSPSHAGYYPGAVPMVLKLLFAPGSGRILGAQIVGAEGVDKRIDVVATAMRAGMTVSDLAGLELAYAPQFGSAKDPVNVVGYAAENIVRGDVRAVYAEDLGSLGDGTVVLDVRTAAEVAQGRIDGSMHIPIDELRGRVSELPRGRRLVVHCQSGLRSYYACRMLGQMGFDAMNLSGGYLMYCASQRGRERIPGLERFRRAGAGR